MTPKTAEPLLLTPASHADLFSMYEHLHANPELSFQEHATAEFVADRLNRVGYAVHRVGGTGVVGVMKNGAGPVVAYRADMDALPVKEQTGLDYASEATGILDGTAVPVIGFPHRKSS